MSKSFAIRFNSKVLRIRNPYFILSNIIPLLFYRFGNLKNGANDIKQHVWFKQTNWVAIYNQEMEAPFIPKTSGAGDTSNFEKQDVFMLRKHSKCLYEKEFNEF